MDNNRLRKSFFILIIAAMLSFIPALPQSYAFAAEEDAGSVYEIAEQPAEVQPCTTSIGSVSAHGSVHLSLSVEDLENAGYKAGDLVSVKIGNAEPVIIPFIDGSASIGFHRPMLSVSFRDRSRTVRALTLRMSEGNFAEAYGITDADTGREVVISMEKQGGFLDEYAKWQLGHMSNNREDFPDLSDEEFANYRNVSTTGMGKGILYRTSSPINPMLGRSAIADEANRSHGVTTIINLSESPESAAKREGYNESYYATVNHYEANMGTDFGSETFDSKFADCMRFMIGYPGVYEVNCIFGKDRTGFMIAVLEGLMGASYEEITADYTATYHNYYPDYNSYEPVSERDKAIAEGNLIAQMQYAYGVDDLKDADIRTATEAYLSSIGLTVEEIGALKKCLSVNRIEYVSAGSVIYNGKVQGPEVSFEGRVLKENVDYTWEKTDGSLSYSDAGKYTAKLTGLGMFYGSMDVQYEILPKQTKPSVKLSKKKYTYNGKVRTPSVTVSDGEDVLDISCYTVSYASDRKSVGSYKVSVELKGSYRGSGSAVFRIVPAGTKIVKIKRSIGSAEIRWKKQAAKMSRSRISGYQIQTAYDRSFTKNRRTVKVRGYSKVSKRITKLKGGKKYYVRIRTYKTRGNRNYYSAWSEIKTVKPRR